MWILCRYKYIISHNILDHISILMARQYFGPLPIISVSQGHFSRTDMAASRDRDLVKMQEIRNLNRRYSVFSQIDFSLDCDKTRMERFFRIEVWIAITRLILYWMFPKGLEPNCFTSEKFQFWTSKILSDLSSGIPWTGGVFKLLTPEISSFSVGRGGAPNEPKKTPTHKYKYEKYKYKCSANTITNNRVVFQVTRVHCSVAKTSDSPWMMGNMH